MALVESTEPQPVEEDVQSSERILVVASATIVRSSNTLYQKVQRSEDD